MKVHYNQCYEVVEVRKKGLVIALYDIATDELEVYEELNGITEEDLVEMCINEVEEINALEGWSDENDQKY